MNVEGYGAPYAGFAKPLGKAKSRLPEADKSEPFHHEYKVARANGSLLGVIRRYWPGIRRRIREYLRPLP
jgi:hypothetical protein